MTLKNKEESREELVWYACYGSNLKRKRFMCYIHGGRPQGSSGFQPGCSDARSPRRELPVLIPHELYFARESESWEGGGVAFLRPGAGGEPTLGRMYLITREQFQDVVAQENKKVPGSLKLDFSGLLEKGRLKLGKGWYDLLLVLTQVDGCGYPILSFSSSREESSRPPGPAYYHVILDGLLETYPHLTEEEARAYLDRAISGK